MNPSSLSLIILAIPPILGSFVVLYLAAVGKGVWISHFASICFACFLALACHHMSKLVERHIAVFVTTLLTCIGLVSTLLGDSIGPERWISVGSFKLYVAPILLPSFIAACSVVARKGDRYQIASFIAVLCVAILLALQPDASQVLGLSVASILIAIRYQPSVFRLGVIVLPLVLVTIWAFSIADPLEPVLHVEEVFRLALESSLFTGAGVIAAALALVFGLWIKSVNGPLWLGAVAVYYASLFACSIAGLTPAPLVGYGAGPILGYGFLVGIIRCIEPQYRLNIPTQRIS